MQRQFGYASRPLILDVAGPHLAGSEARGNHLSVAHLPIEGDDLTPQGSGVPHPLNGLVRRVGLRIEQLARRLPALAWALGFDVDHITAGHGRRSGTGV